MTWRRAVPVVVVLSLGGCLSKDKPRTTDSAVQEAAPAAGNWGCESTSGSQASKYVQSVNTDINGVIMVTTSAATDLGPAASKEIDLTPQTTGGTAIVAASIGGTQVQAFKCAPGVIGGGTAMDSKYLPGSCK